jgi:hypothetical protein
MNDKDILEFIKAFKDFMKHSDVEEYYHEGRQAYLKYENNAKEIVQNEIEKKASELNVSVDYYLQEFV